MNAITRAAQQLMNGKPAFLRTVLIAATLCFFFAPVKVNGQAGSALNFDGTDDQVQITGYKGIPGAGVRTIEAWINTTSNTASTILEYGSTNNGQMFSFGINGSGRLQLDIFNNIITSTNTVNDGNWHHVAIVVNNSNLANIQFYIDGILESNSAVTGPGSGIINTDPAGTDVRIGYSPGLNTFFQGTIDEVRIWNSTRSLAQIHGFKDCQVAPNANLVANYRFNQGTAGGNNAGITNLIDDTGNGRNGTLQNFALIGATSNWVSPGGIPSGISCNPSIGDYTSTASGPWSAASTWARYDGTTWVNAVSAPSSADNIITITSGITVTINSNITADQVVVNTGGTLALNGPFTFTLNDGTGNDLNVNGTVSITGSAIAYQPGSSISVNSGGSLLFNAGTMSGDGSLIVQNGGNLNFNGTGVMNMPGTKTITNNGNINWTSTSGLFNFAGGTITLNNNAIINISANAAMNNGGNGSSTLTINNSSTSIITKTGSGTGTLGAGVLVSSTIGGIILISNGILQFNEATLTNFGTLQFNGGNTLELLNSTTNLNGNTFINGNGNIDINGGATNLQFAVQVPSGITVNLTAGALQGVNKIRFLSGSIMNWSGGELTGNANTELDNGAILNITGNVGLRGNHYITNNGTINWNGAGNIDYDGGSTNSQILNNAIFNISNSGNITHGGGSNFFTLTNSASGTINKSNGTTSLNDNVNFESFGTVNVNSGVFVLNNNFSTHSGTYNISNGAELTGNTVNFTGNIFTNNGLVSNNEINFSGGFAQTISGNGEFQTIRISNSDGVNLSGSPLIYFFLHFGNGKIIAGNNILRTNAGLTITGANGTSYVVGRMNRIFSAGTSTLPFPIGSASYYTPVSVTLNGVATTADITVRNFDEDHPNLIASNLFPNKTVNSYWEFDNNGAYSTADVTFNWDPAQVDPGANTTNFVVDEYDSDFSVWTLRTSSNQQPTSITATGISNFQDRFYVIGEASPPGQLDDYRTIASGNWNNANNWQRHDGTSWTPAVSAPDGANSNAVTIREGYTLSLLSSSANIDQLVIENGAELQVIESSLNILNGSGTDLQVFGQLLLNPGSLSIAANAVAIIESDGTLRNESFSSLSGPGTLTILNGGQWTDNSGASDLLVNNKIGRAHV